VLWTDVLGVAKGQHEHANDVKEEQANYAKGGTLTKVLGEVNREHDANHDIHYWNEQK
jgi:hypothetical protein